MNYLITLIVGLTSAALIASGGCTRPNLLADASIPEADAETAAADQGPGSEPDGDGGDKPTAPPLGSVADVDEFSCDASLAGWRVVDLAGTSPEATIRIDKQTVYAGTGALEYSYRLAPGEVPVLFNMAQTTELQRIAFQLRSEKASSLVVALGDVDGAVFFYLFTVAADQWTRVEIRPEDMMLSPSSPVAKDQIDTASLGAGFFLFDLASTKGASGENRLWLDSVVIEREPIVEHAGPWVIEGQEQVTESTLASGDIVIKNGGRLEVSARRFTVRGKIDIQGGGSLLVDQTILSVPQLHHSQYPLFVGEAGKLEIRDTRFVNTLPVDLRSGRGGQIVFSGVSMMLAGLHFDVETQASLVLDRVKNVGEIVPTDASRVTIKDTDTVLIWLPINTTVQLALPDKKLGGGDWSLNPKLDIDLTISNTENIFWGLISLPSSNLTLQDTTILACGLVFLDQQPTTHSVRGLRNDQVYANLEQILSDRKITLNNSTVATWNYYALGKVKLIVEDSLFGEIMTFNQSSADVRDAHCDGTGGYVASLGSSRLRLRDSTIDADVVAHDQSEIVLEGCEVNGNVSATDSTVIQLTDTAVNGAVRSFGKGLIK